MATTFSRSMRALAEGDLFSDEAQFANLKGIEDILHFTPRSQLQGNDHHAPYPEDLMIAL